MVDKRDEADNLTTTVTMLTRLRISDTVCAPMPYSPKKSVMKRSTRRVAKPNVNNLRI